MSDTIERRNSANAKIVFFDLETGGLETHRPITQIAAIAVDQQLNELDSFEVKIRFDEAKACPGCAAAKSLSACRMETFGNRAETGCNVVLAIPVAACLGRGLPQ